MGEQRPQFVVLRRIDSCFAQRTERQRKISAAFRHAGEEIAYQLPVIVMRIK